MTEALRPDAPYGLSDYFNALSHAKDTLLALSAGRPVRDLDEQLSWIDMLLSQPMSGAPRSDSAAQLTTEAESACRSIFHDYDKSEIGRAVTSTRMAWEVGGRLVAEEAAAPISAPPNSGVVSVPRKLLDSILNVAEETEARWPNDSQFSEPCDELRELLGAER